MRRLTPAQRGVLERMASGDWMIYSVRSRRFSVIATPIRFSTGNALVRRRLVRFARWLEGESLYVISDVGRAALAAAGAGQEG